MTKNVFVIKSKHQTYFTSSEKNMIINVYEHVKGTWPADEYPYKTKLNEKTAAVCGIGIASVYRILKEYATHERVTSPVLTKKRLTFSEKIDADDKSTIRKIVHSHYMRGELPTFKKILQAVNDDENLPNFKKSTFHKILKHLKFRNVRLKGTNALVENNDVVLWRLNYLKTIKVYRNQNRNIFYINEAVLNIGNSDAKCYMDTSTHTRLKSNEGAGTSTKNTTSRSKSLVILHIGSKTGFLEAAEHISELKTQGDPHESIDANNFEYWFEQNLAKLGEGSVVVMNAAPYNTRRSEKTPSIAWTKGDIQEWLLHKEINFDQTDVKVELLKRVRDIKKDFQSYAVDELARKYKVDILRLPPYHGELNPGELVWSDVKDHLEITDTSFTFEQIKSLLQASIRNVSPDKWQSCITHVTHVEDFFYNKLDVLIDNTMDTFGVNVSDTDSDTESCSSSTDESLLKYTE
ncbi:uncharacterized protein LOC116776357 isoform X2 [Danaus plexippus]|uniref:uncharacterized protein LOC116776357 isoform X2 n=1 Tax=Danaus plexippus TaxID=13037 RepID=UPI002AB2FE96|nr:uncharacterized protein LOC116776357 isoform X2 [Danaus plexippus]